MSTCNQLVTVAPLDGHGVAVYNPGVETEATKAVKRGARASGTSAVYGRVAEQWKTWCAARGVPSVNPNAADVSNYLTELHEAGKSPSTVGLHLAAIAHAHRHAQIGFDTSLFESTMDGIRRGARKDGNGKTVHTVKPVKKAAPATLDKLSTLPADDSLKSIRDRAIILLGFWAARRRSELSGLDLGSASDGATGFVELANDGIVVNLLKSKTNQEGEAERYAVPKSDDDLCAVDAVRAWIEASGITSGPLFRQITKGGVVGGRLSGESIGKVVKSRLGDAHTGHALRRGFMVEGARLGLTAIELARQSGHKSMDMVNAYTKDAELFTVNSAAKLRAKKGGA